MRPLKVDARLPRGRARHRPAVGAADGDPALARGVGADSVGLAAGNADAGLSACVEIDSGSRQGAEVDACLT